MDDRASRSRYRDDVQQLRAQGHACEAYAREASEDVREPGAGVGSGAGAHRCGARRMIGEPGTRLSGRSAMLRLSSLVGERTLFENDSYRRLWLAKLLSHVPTNALVYTMLLLVVDATGKSFFSSLFVVAYIAPTAFLGTISGVLVDRMPKGI